MEDMEIIPRPPPRYTSLIELLPPSSSCKYCLSKNYGSATMTPRLQGEVQVNIEDILIRDDLVRKAARAYLRPRCDPGYQYTIQSPSQVACDRHRSFIRSSWNRLKAMSLALCDYFCRSKKMKEYEARKN
ncbi:hypothetical protein MLD38_009538 [Melastoma candidum]|uniref:Uncharacterized protein n=1 Tax=Melastoma candidum TaxID=119954 RepID=A0ACB9S1K0_9MYRT|nr:hypothetical protein MLD38_009538 [Melastoma candidum]